MIKFKLYSIQSGKPKKSSGLFGEFKNKSIKYAPIGAAIGAGYGAISEDDGVIKSALKGAGIGVILAALDTALGYFRRKEIRESSVDDIISKMRQSAPITPNDYTVNSDPYSSKLSVAISGGIMVMYINDLTDNEITIISDQLDESCKEDRYSDYKSQPMENGGYLVTVVLSSMKSVCKLLTSIINDLGIKINIISKVKSSNKSFSIREKYDSFRNDKKGYLKSLIRKNRKVQSIEKITPGVVDDVIDNLSVDSIIDKANYGKDTIKGLKG